jgi:hypothetical protein
MHHVHDYKLPLPIVQKQVGHKTLKATSVYLKPSDEAVAEAYAEVAGASSVRGRAPFSVKQEKGADVS